MHKIYIFILLLLPALFSNLSAQITFEKTYGGAKDEIGRAVIQANDGGYFIAGTTSSFTANLNDAYLIKTDSFGTILWTKTYGDTTDLSISLATQTKDGGIVMCGSKKRSTSTPISDIYLLKIKGNGVLDWARVLKTDSNFEAKGYSVQQTADDGFIVSGYILNTDFNGTINTIIVKMDLNGYIQWTKIFGVNQYDIGLDVRQTLDKGYIVTGYTRLAGAGADDIYLTKLDSTGNNLWFKTYGGNFHDRGNCVQQTADSGFIIAGSKSSFNNNSEDIYLIKTDVNGDTIWTKTYGNYLRDEAQYVEQTTDGGYIVAGYTITDFGKNIEANLIKTNASGDITWAKTFGRDGTDLVNAVHQTIDGGYIIAGSTSGLLNEYYDIYLIKTDANGNACSQKNATYTNPPFATKVSSAVPVLNSVNIVSTKADSTFLFSGGTSGNACPSVGIDETQHNNKLLIYPNPSTGVFSIELPNEIESGRIEVFHINGQMVFSEAVSHTSKKTITLNNIAEGIYFVKLFDGVGYSLQKLMVRE